MLQALAKDVVAKGVRRRRRRAVAKLRRMFPSPSQVRGMTPAERAIVAEVRKERALNNGSKTVSTAVATAPVSVGVQSRNIAPRSDRIVLKHSELLTQVYGSVAYDITTFNINAGIASVFPWLSQMAILWEMYEFTQFKVRYEIGTSTSEKGAVFLAFDYDVYDDDPNSKSLFMMMSGAISSAPWQRMDMSLPAAKLKQRGPLFVSGSSTVSAGDAKTYQLGKILVGTQGQAADNTYLGDIYIDYTCSLTMPQAPTSGSSSFIQVSSGTLTANKPFGVGPYNDNVAAPVGIMSNGTTYTTWTWKQSGTYVAILRVDGTTLTTAASDLGDIQFNTGKFSNDKTIEMCRTTSGTTSIYVNWFRVTADQQTLINVNSAASVTLAQLCIAPINPEVNSGLTSVP